MASSDHVIVATKNGQVRGLNRNTFEGIPFASFHGIPYGKPPVGDLRFKAPQPADSWTEILDATAQTKVAAGTRFFTSEYEPLSNEDCLHLNVFTPSIKTNHLKPVMVWIHGGGWAHGTNEESIYGPDFLLRNDVVLVTISYRLGPLGFLSVADPKFEIPGNAGLKDQTLGLRWVQANIDRFGGDPNNVTLFGESAGSASTHCHMMSDYSKGLFHRAIMQSGSALAAFAIQPNDTNINRVLAKKLGWNGDGGIDAMMNVLLNADAKDIMIKQQGVNTAIAQQKGSMLGFVACVVPYGDIGSAFIRVPLVEQAKNAWGNSIPLLIGCTSDEGINFVPYCELSLGEHDPIFSNYSPGELKLEDGSQQSISNGVAIKNFYYGNADPISASDDIFAKLLADKMFWHGTIGAIRNRTRVSDSAPTFLYRFSFDSRVPSFRRGVFVEGLKKTPGCTHAEDLMYLFRQQNVHKNFDFSVESTEADFIARFVDIWTTFAKTGNPNCSQTAPLVWKALADGDEPFKCMQLAEKTEIIELPEWERIAFWDSLYKY